MSRVSGCSASHVDQGTTDTGRRVRAVSSRGPASAEPKGCNLILSVKRFLVIAPRRYWWSRASSGVATGAEVHRLGGHQDRRSRRGARVHCERGGLERLPTGVSVARLFSDATGCRHGRRSPQDGLLGTDCGDSVHPVVARQRGTDQARREEECYGRAPGELPYGRATRPARTIQSEVAVTWIFHLAPVNGCRCQRQ